MMTLALLLLADGVVDVASVLPGVSTLGSLGIAVWHVYWTTTVTIPKMHEDHKAERLEMQSERTKIYERFDSTMHDLLTEMKQQREQYSHWRESGFGRDSSMGSKP